MFQSFDLGNNNNLAHINNTTNTSLFFSPFCHYQKDRKHLSSQSVTIKKVKSKSDVHNYVQFNELVANRCDFGVLKAYKESGILVILFITNNLRKE